MVPLAYYDQHFVPLEHSYQLAATSSLARQYTDEKLNQPNNQSVVRVQSHSNNLVVPPPNSSQKVQRCSELPSVTSQDTISGDCYNGVLKSPLSHSKHQATPSLHLQRRTPLWPNNKKALSSPLSHPKPQNTSSFDLIKTLSPEPSQTDWSSQLSFPKPQNTSSLDLFWTSPPLKSIRRVSSSSLYVNHQETPSQDYLWTSSSLEPNQRAFSSALPQSKPQKPSSLDSLWSSLLERNQRCLSSPSLNSTSQINYLFQTSPEAQHLEPSQMTLSSSLPDPRLQTPPVLRSNSSVLRLPLSNSKPRKSPLPHSVQQSKSLPLPKTLDHDFRTPSSAMCQSRLHDTTSPSDKHKATDLSSAHPKPNVSGQSLFSSRHSMRSIAALTLGSRLQRKSSFDHCEETGPGKEIPWTLDYTQPCIVKGGTVPSDVVNKIVNSLSKTRIQRDLCRQILFRRMRGRPNPRPGPRLSSSYMVCLACASCIRSHCSHLTGRKDPHAATLFVIPTPELTPEKEITVKLVFILSLPETTFLLPVKENQPDEAPEDSLEGMEKMSNIFPTSESDTTQGASEKKTWLTEAPENRAVSQRPQAVDWLLYVKRNSSPQFQPVLPSSASSTSLSSSSSSSSSSFSSSTIAPLPPPPPPKGSAVSDCVVTKLLSYHRLPPGVSWLEFICSKNHQPLPGKPRPSQSPSPKARPMRNSTTVKRRKGPKTVFRIFQTKFQNERNLD